MKINVIAKESSGRKLVDSLLRQHPNIDVMGYSFPSEPPPNRGYLSLREADFTVIVARDRTCQESSVTDRHYNDGTPNQFGHDENIQAILDAVRKTAKPIYFFSYETALLYRQDYLDWFFRLLGLQPVKVSTEWVDGNVKYFSKP